MGNTMDNLQVLARRVPVPGIAGDPGLREFRRLCQRWGPAAGSAAIQRAQY